MQTAGLTSSQDYQNFLAAKVTTGSSALVASTNATVAANYTEPSGNIMAFGGVSLFMLLEGVANYMAYDSFVTTLNTNNVGTKTLWTTTWLKASTPLRGWFYLSQSVIALSSVSVLGFIFNLAGLPIVFFTFTRLALIWPIIMIPLVGVAYTQYVGCSSLSSSNFTGTTDSS